MNRCRQLCELPAEVIRPPRGRGESRFDKLRISVPERSMAAYAERSFRRMPAAPALSKLSEHFGRNADRTELIDRPGLVWATSLRASPA